MSHFIPIIKTSQNKSESPIIKRPLPIYNGILESPIIKGSLPRDKDTPKSEFPILKIPIKCNFNNMSLFNHKLKLNPNKQSVLTKTDISSAHKLQPLHYTNVGFDDDIVPPKYPINLSQKERIGMFVFTSPSPTKRHI